MIALVLFDIKSCYTGEKYDLKSFRNKDNEKLENALLMAFDPFTNEEIQKVIDVGMEDPDEEVQKNWKKVPYEGEKPSPEELIQYLVGGYCVWRRKHVKKYNRKQIMGMPIIGTIMVCSACGRTEAAVPDVVGSMKMNRDEMLTVVANQDKIEDKEAFARLLIQMRKDNSFDSIKFSVDEGYPTSLDMNVYAWKEDIGEKDPI